MTDDLSQRLARASSHLDAGFHEHDHERVLGGLERRIVRRRRIRSAAVASSLVALAVLGFFSLPHRPEAPLAQQTELRTQDGSLASVLEPETELSVEQDGEHEVQLSLTRGAGHFDVSKRVQRRYRVRAGSVDVQVLGTVFDVRRRGTRTQVLVTHGAVQVTWPSGQTILHAGESDWFPRTEPAQPRAAIVEQTHEEVSAPTTPPSADKSDAWRTLARAGKHGEAFRSLHRARGERVEDLEGLLLAADAARLSDHPREAVPYLSRLVKRYPKTAPAKLAAFTLGGLQLHELEAPALAARSFAQAYRLDPDGPLAEDALAREAEAHALAGHHEQAASVAARYLARYPKGARRGEMARYHDK